MLTIKTMKRLFVFIIIVLLLCGINLNITKELNFQNIFSGASVEVYISDKSYNGNLSVIDNGCGQIVCCGIDDLNYIFNNF